MMEPIRSSLSTLLYNSITLVGSVGMCYYTSYELSMLAFVTVGPIMYLWDLYGNWSKVGIGVGVVVVKLKIKTVFFF